MTGARIGPYEVIAQIGAGGMGEVYRATDTALKRQVAIKVLPTSFANDPDRLARFKREAQLLAALNHPHIANIYGFEDTAGVHALVMELVEGPTLAERIAHGPLPLDEALPIARQITDALEAAHAHGIIHRDLKPANIKVKSDGTVKVLDFGLAKALDRAGESGGPELSDLSASPTLTSPAMTLAGVVLGTAAYMAPEQARGKAVDKRADVWAFGCVLYEMLASRRAFDGEEVSDTLAAVLRAEPDWSALPASTPPAIRRLLKRALQKDAKLRLRDIADARIELDDAITAPSPEAPVQVVGRSRAGWIVAAATAVIAAVALGAIAITSAPDRPAVRRFEVMTRGLSMVPGGQNVAISSDGGTIAYTGMAGGRSVLYVRRLADLESRLVAGTEGVNEPFFSPDGQQVGFFQDGKLKRMPLGGGPAATICEVPGIYGAAWGDGDIIVFGGRLGQFGLFRVPAAGGRPERLTTPAEDGPAHRNPEMLPGGQVALFTDVPQGRLDRARIVAVNLATNEQTVLVENGIRGRYAQSGHLVYATPTGTIMAAPFDVRRLTLLGPAAPVLEGVMFKGNGNVNIALARDGTLVYVPGVFSAPEMSAIWMDRNGTATDAVATPLPLPRDPALSTDGGKLAVTTGANATGDIWVFDLRGAAQPRKMTFEGDDASPLWSKDGSRLFFYSIREGTRGIYELPADGSRGEPQRIGSGMPLDVSPDGAVLLTSRVGAATRGDISTLSLRGDNTEKPWLATPFDEGEAKFSPDGEWVAYTSDETGAVEVWVRPFSGAGAPVRVSPQGGRQPRWSADGKELFFEREDGGPTLLAVPVLEARSGFRVGPPSVVVAGGFMGSPHWYDVASDGRFLLIKRKDGGSGTGDASLVVTLNWLEELKRLAPSK